MPREEAHADMITIVSYKPTWPDEFMAIGRQLRHALGDLALRIDHIGSTSVPGLAAKDRIDIQITAESLHPSIEQALQTAGYKRLEHITKDHLPPGSTDEADWVKWFFLACAPEQAVNLHVRLEGRANQRYPILFRDYLRKYPDMAEAYSRVKLALVAHQLDDMDAYYDVKDPVCDIIIGGAEAWAQATGWEQGPSDC
jgi:GrpB-like predicted nucleotidyltransferase (UPF0157 family)